MIRFSVAALEKSPVVLAGTLPCAFLELDADPVFAPTAPVEYELTGKLLSGGGVLVSGHCATKLRATCGRCLNEFEWPLSADLQLFFELEEGQEELEVGEDVRAELLLGLPMNPVCRPDCKGLCPVCGTDRNLRDCGCAAAPTAGKSPWSALDDLKLD